MVVGVNLVPEGYLLKLEPMIRRQKTHDSIVITTRTHVNISITAHLATKQHRCYKRTNAQIAQLMKYLCVGKLGASYRTQADRKPPTLRDMGLARIT